MMVGSHSQSIINVNSLLGVMSDLMIFPVVFEQRILQTEALNCDVGTRAEISCDI